MKVCLATGHDPNYKDLAAITLPTVKNYCKRWGYYLSYDGGGTDKDACKVRLYEEVYNSRQFDVDDVFVWVDTDLLIMNSNRRIENIVYEHMPRSVHFLIGVDPNGLNSGCYIARFTPEAALFLTVANGLSAVSGWGDQMGTQYTALGEPHHPIYKEVPGRVFNSNLYDEKGWRFGEYGRYINEYQPGDLALHLAGVEEPRRSELLSIYAKLAV